MCPLDFQISDVARHHQIALPKNNCVRMLYVADDRLATTYICVFQYVWWYITKKHVTLWLKKAKSGLLPLILKKETGNHACSYYSWDESITLILLTERGYFFSKLKLGFGQFLEVWKVHRTVMSLQSFSDLYEFHIHLPWLYWHLWMNNLEIKE